MAFISGPRQVGKTSICREITSDYLNWDNQDTRETILKGPAKVAQTVGLEKLHDVPRIVAFDEIHRYARWKTF